jgi:hypothetical protein
MWWPFQPQPQRPQTQAPQVVTTAPSETPPSAPATSPTPAVSSRPGGGGTPVRVSADRTKQALLDMIDKGELEGAIREDVARDLRNVIRDLARPEQWQNVKTKIADRRREGAIAPELADRLLAEVKTIE